MRLRIRSRLGRWVGRGIRPLLGDPTPFAIVCNARTGSNFLLSLLNSSPWVRTHGEVIGEAVLDKPGARERIAGLGLERYLASYFRRTSLEKAAGIKLLYHQLCPEYSRTWDLPALAGATQALVARRDVKILHLRRRNMLRTLVSARVADVTQQYKLASEAERRVVTITLDPGDCEASLNKIEEWDRDLTVALRGHQVLDLWYEDLRDDPQGQGAQAQAFLGVHPRPLASSLVKQRQGTMRDVVVNYDDLKRRFATSPWASYFVD